MARIVINVINAQSFVIRKRFFDARESVFLQIEQYSIPAKLLIERVCQRALKCTVRVVQLVLKLKNLFLKLIIKLIKNSTYVLKKSMCDKKFYVYVKKVLSNDYLNFK